MTIIIKFDSYQVEAKLFDTPTGRAIYQALPFQENVNCWGDEIYFGFPVKTELEAAAKAEVEVGDLAYWPNMPAFCIFFGPTPVSTGNSPVAASPVNVFGKLSLLDPETLRRVADGERVSVEKAT